MITGLFKNTLPPRQAAKRCGGAEEYRSDVDPPSSDRHTNRIGRRGNHPERAESSLGSFMLATGASPWGDVPPIIGRPLGPIHGTTDNHVRPYESPQGAQSSHITGFHGLAPVATMSKGARIDVGRRRVHIATRKTAEVELSCPQESLSGKTGTNGGRAVSKDDHAYETARGARRHEGETR